MMQLFHRIDIAQRHILKLLKYREIRKIGDARKTYHCNVDRRLLPRIKPGRQTVLILEGNLHVRHHPDDRNAAALFQLPDSRRKNGHIAPEFIDDKSFYPPALRLLQKKLCPEQLREHSAPVNISGDQHRRIQKFRQPHVHDIVLF